MDWYRWNLLTSIFSPNPPTHFRHFLLKLQRKWLPDESNGIYTFKLAFCPPEYCRSNNHISFGLTAPNQLLTKFLVRIQTLLILQIDTTLDSTAPHKHVAGWHYVDVSLHVLPVCRCFCQPRCERELQGWRSQSCQMTNPRPCFTSMEASPHARHHRTTPELLCSCLDGSEPSPVHAGTSMDQRDSLMFTTGAISVLHKC